MKTRLILLGTGTSHGIPMIGCDCAVCTSSDPRDHRTRCSAAVQVGEVMLLIDTGPELRLQCVANGVHRADAILFTHFHADHVVGLDDVRRFNWLQGGAVRLFGDAATINRLRTMFAYAFDKHSDYPSSKPDLDTSVISGPFEAAGVPVTPLPYLHGTLPVFGYRIGDVAYCPDCSEIPPSTRELMRGLDVLVLDALRRRPHPTHFTLDQAVEEARRIGAARTFFTHIAHELPHAATCAELPQGMTLAYDGLVLES